MSIRTRWQSSATRRRLAGHRREVFFQGHRIGTVRGKRRAERMIRREDRRQGGPRRSPRQYLSGERQRYRNWLNRRAAARGRSPLPDRITRGAGSRLPVVRDRINPATGRPRWTDRSDGALARWRADRERVQGRDARNGAGPPRTPGVYELREHRWVPARDFRAPDLRARLPRGR